VLPADVVGVVLAGGRATRFGADKLAAPLAGRPLLHHAVLAASAASAQVLVAVAADAAPPPLPEVAVPVRVVRDESADLGPLAGLAAALDALRATRGQDRLVLLVVAGDAPYLGRSLLDGLVASLGPSDAAAVLVDGDAWRPLPCVVRAAAAAPVVAAHLASADRSIRAVLRTLRPAIVDEAVWRTWDPDGAWRGDVDRPPDLAAARRQEAT